MDYNAAEGCHKVHYDDDAEEWLVLAHERFTWLSPRGCSAGCSPEMQVLTSTTLPTISQAQLEPQGASMLSASTWRAPEHHSSCHESFVDRQAYLGRTCV